MPINFVQLLQDSWNFMRNQYQFSLFAILLLLILQLSTLYLLPQTQLSSAELQSPDMVEKVLQAQLMPAVIQGLISVFINILIILNIKSINNGNYHHFFQHLSGVGKYFFAVLVLTLLMVMPLSFSVALGGVAVQGSSLSIMMIPLMIVGIFIFVKLCLVIYVYLVEEPQKKMGESIKFVWELSRGKMRILFLFCVLSYLVPSLLSSVIANLVGGEIGLFISQVFGAALTLFLVIFGFRFYQVFRSLPRSL